MANCKYKQWKLLNDFKKLKEKNYRLILKKFSKE